MKPFNNPLTENPTPMHWELLSGHLPSGAGGVLGSWKSGILREAASLYAERYYDLNGCQPTGKHHVILIVGCEPNYFDIRDTLSYQGNSPWVMETDIMYEEDDPLLTVEIQAVSPESAACWRSAALHLKSRVQGGIENWFRGNLIPPFREHLSFQLEGQNFFIHVVDFNGRVQVPSSLEKLILVAQENNGYACIMRMTKNFAGEWVPVMPGWGLTDIHTNEPVNPSELVR